MKILGKVKANKIKVILFPVTPYFEEYYKLWSDKSKNNPKKKQVRLYGQKCDEISYRSYYQ